MDFKLNLMARRFCKKNLAPLFIVFIVTFQNCGGFQTESHLLATAAGSSYCSKVGKDKACTAPVAATCSFNGQPVAESAKVTAFLTSTTAPGGGCVSEKRTCHGGALSGSYSYASCVPMAPLACLFNGVTLASGAMATAFRNSSMPFGSTCSSEVRSCKNGSLSGSFAYATCQVAQPAACLFNGQTVAHGQSVQAFPASNVPYGGTCQPIARTCFNGALSGQGDFGTCVVAKPASCLFNGQTIAHGQSVQAFAVSTVPSGASCQATTRTCDNGVLNGSGDYASCVPAQAASCLINGQTIPSGGTITLYFSAADTSCANEVRNCSNGNLSGSATFGSCQLQPTLTCVIQMSACPNHPEAGTNITEGTGGSAACLQRANDYYGYCGGSGRMNTRSVTATFFTNGQPGASTTVGGAQANSTVNVLNARINAGEMALDYLIQDVCVDGSDAPIQGDPATCANHRNLRIGERVPYLRTDFDAAFGNALYQAVFSYPVPGTDGKLKIMVAKSGDSGAFGSGYTFSFNLRRDGYDLLDANGPYVSGIRTSDGGCFDQRMDGSDGRTNGWIFFAPGGGGGNLVHGIAITELSANAPASCQGVRRGTGANDVWNPPAMVRFESGKNLMSIITYHFAAQNLSQTNNALERYYFTREYGFTRWEAYIPLSRCQTDFASNPSVCNPSDPNNFLRGRCGNNNIPATTTFGGQTWVRTDCRDSTNYIPIDTPVFPLDGQMGQNDGLQDIDSGAVFGVFP